MKRFYILLLALFAGFAVQAADFVKSKSSGLRVAAVEAQAATDIELTSTVQCNYDNSFYGDGIADYYSIVGNAEFAYFDSNAGQITAKNGWIATFDCINVPSEPLALPEGTYTLVEDPYPDSPQVFQALSDYSELYYYDAEGNKTVTAVFTGTISVVRSEETYTVKGTAVDEGGNTYNVVFNGKLPFIDPSYTQSVYRQINEDNEDIAFKGGLAYYYGKFHLSTAGTIMIQLYTGAYTEDGASIDDVSKMICIDINQRYFPNKENITIDEGVYPIAMKYERGKAVAAHEIDFMGQTIPIGSYLRDSNPDKYGTGTARHAYGYLRSGTFTITKTDKGYKIVLPDGVTDRGYKVTFSYEGPIDRIIDGSADEPNKALSTIEDDVDLNLPATKARVYTESEDNGMYLNGYPTLIVDIGSRSGRDPELDNGGNIMRLQFITYKDVPYVLPGTYQVAEEEWEYMLEPWKLTQSRWRKLPNGGGSDISGTCFMDFEQGRYYVMSDYAWITAGKVTVTAEGYDQNAKEIPSGTNYTFDIDLVADNGFYVKGKWSGPLEYNYSPGNFSGISHVAADPAIVAAGEGRYSVVNYAGQVDVFNVAGALVGCFNAAGIDLSAMPTGIYFVKTANKTFKVCK